MALAGRKPLSLKLCPEDGKQNHTTSHSQLKIHKTGNLTEVNFLTKTDKARKTKHQTSSMFCKTVTKIDAKNALHHQSPLVTRNTSTMGNKN